MGLISLVLLLGFLALIGALGAFVVALGFVWLASLGVFLVGKAKGSKLLSWAGGISLAASSLVGVAFVLLISCFAIYLGFNFARVILQL